MKSSPASRCLWALAACLIVGAARTAPAEGALEAAASATVEKAPETEPRTVRELVERLEPWVVSIQVQRSGDLPTMAAGLGALPPEMRSYYERPAGWVSGILLDGDGWVTTTAYNLAGDVKSIEVRLPGGETFPARLVSRSEEDDLGLLKIDLPESSAPLRTGEPPWSDRGVRTGQIVLAVGRSPDPTRLTVTRGIVSALGRNGGRAFQTDAELNYGNVGGPLLDLDGRIVGMAAFVGHNRPQWGVNSGVGFGTTAATIRKVLPDLKRGGSFVAFKVPFLGVRESIKYTGAGAKIEAVVDGPAKSAGVEAGDVIVEFDGKSVASFGELRRLIFEKSVGTNVKLKVQRGEDTIELEVTLAEMVGS